MRISDIYRLILSIPFFTIFEKSAQIQPALDVSPGAPLTRGWVGKSQRAPEKSAQFKQALDVSPSTPLTPLYAVRGEWWCADFLGNGYAVRGEWRCADFLGMGKPTA